MDKAEWIIIKVKCAILFFFMYNDLHYSIILEFCITIRLIEYFSNSKVIRS